MKAQKGFSEKAKKYGKKMKSYSQEFSMNLATKGHKKDSQEDVRQNKKIAYKKQELLNVMELLNQEITRMKEVMIEMHHMIATNPEGKEEISKDNERLRRLRSHANRNIK